MARNEEKAQSMLYRFRQAQAESLGLMSHSLSEAEKWRHQVIREISKKVTQIQDTGLTDFQVRDLNDTINKQLREKRRWEDQIKYLGGPDYKRSGPKMLDREGKEAPGAQGYRYFGRAKDLPGVRELFATTVVTPDVKSRFELYRNVDADYYGYRDEADGELLDYEKSIETQLRANGTPLFTSEDDISTEKKVERKKRSNPFDSPERA
ncbi:NineTeen Complex (NTC) component [Entomophthora muscae]|uniref:NineTeen Complex (NTC) component n=1 Tax=Entomophthora muscae TaxID=34485 RepID=A0ACC2TBH6_9FUNG|nr:NineTeen Complex (NTC) component [Entomophthora muscae]